MTALAAPGTIDRDLTAALLLDSAASFVEKGWTRGAAARDERGSCCSAIDERAAKWCATGALFAAEFDSGLRKRQGVMSHAAVTRAHDVRVRAEEALKRATGIDFIAGWNDRQGQTAATVARSMREAAAKLREVVS